MFELNTDDWAGWGNETDVAKKQTCTQFYALWQLAHSQRLLRPEPKCWACGEQQVKATKHWETWLCYFRKSTLILIGLMEVDRAQLPVSRHWVRSVSGESFSNVLSVFICKHFLFRASLLTAGAGSAQRPLLRCSFSALGDWTAAAWFVGCASSCQHNGWHLLRKLGSVWKSRP